MMTCHYCRATNSEDEHRCRRCGRRLSGPMSETMSESRGISVQGALATAPAPVPIRRQEPVEPPPAPRHPTQRLLFNMRDGGNVIPFESRMGAPVAPKPARTHTRRPAARRAPDTQQSLDFLPPAPQAARKLKTTVDAVIYCDAPVAAKMHRAVAAALDASMVLIAFGVFLLTFHLSGGDFLLDPASMTVFGLALGGVALFYHLVWIVARCDTPGRRWMHLRLSNFDGFPPDPMQRIVRFAGTCLSLAALGTGILWSVVDEESLGWHDHISKTFLTLRDQESNFVRQR